MSTDRVRGVAVAWGIVLVLVLAGLTALVDGGSLRVTDHLLLAAAQVPSGPIPDLLMVALSLLGSLEVTTVVMLLLVLVGRDAGPLEWRRFVPLAVFVGVNALEVVAKAVVHQPGPPLALLRGPWLPGLALTTSGAYPSGHMARITLAAALVALRRFRLTANAAWLWGCVALVWAVGYSRVYLAHHWPADVAGGILLGGIGLCFCLALSPRASVGLEEVSPP